MKPKTKIFLDSGDPAETKQIKALLGFLDGQTTNPTLVAKNPFAAERFKRGDKFSKAEIMDFYKQVVEKISSNIPDGSVSIEVYADMSTTADQMFKQGSEMFSWIPNAHIKYPTTKQGLAAAEQSVRHGMRVNMTLCFNQEQAAAIYAATKGAKKGDVFVSPFLGRLDDLGENGLSLISNIIEMYENSDHHVEVLAASVRNSGHLMECLAMEVDIITAPYSVLKEWADAGKPLPAKSLNHEASPLKTIAYRNIDLNLAWNSYNIDHPLTDKGIDRFAEDWNGLIG